MTDEHKKFTLRGGPNNKMVVRLYPDHERNGHVKREVWNDLSLGTELYVLPADADQNPKKPYLLWSER